MYQPKISIKINFIGFKFVQHISGFELLQLKMKNAEQTLWSQVYLFLLILLIYIMLARISF